MSLPKAFIVITTWFAGYGNGRTSDPGQIGIFTGLRPVHHTVPPIEDLASDQYRPFFDEMAAKGITRDEATAQLRRLREEAFDQDLVLA